MTKQSTKTTPGLPRSPRLARNDVCGVTAPTFFTPEKRSLKKLKSAPSQAFRGKRGCAKGFEFLILFKFFIRKPPRYSISFYYYNIFINEICNLLIICNNCLCKIGCRQCQFLFCCALLARILTDCKFFY